MKLSTSLVVVACMLSGGCASLGSAISGPQAVKSLGQSDGARQALHRATPCCQRYADIHYQDFSSISDTTVLIDQSRDVFNFQDGKSYFIAYKLPTNRGSFRITLTSLFTQSVFVPKVMLLDEKFNVTRVLDSSIFKFEPAALLHDNQFSGVFTIDRTYRENERNETYMLIYTPEKTLGETTSVDTEEMRYAKARALATPRNAKMTISHSAWGNINLNVEYLADLNSQNNTYIPEPPATGISMQSGGVSGPATTHISTVADEETLSVMLKETENFYNQQITKALQQKDYPKAVALYKEAKRLGSPTAEQVFLRGIEH